MSNKHIVQQQQHQLRTYLESWLDYAQLWHYEGGKVTLKDIIS